MALTGNLSDLSIAELIQLQCQSGAQARLTVRRGTEQYELYFDGGDVVHAQGMGLEGETAVYSLLLWDDGVFDVAQNVAPPANTIRIPWSALVLEGMRRKDEQQTNPESVVFVDTPIEDPVERALQDLASRTSFQGLVAVSRDGVVLASVLPAGMDSTRAGAVAAGLLSLSGRSVGQLGRGELQQTLVQGSLGNLIITQAGPQAVLLALSDPSLNLGMAFLEAREGAQALAQVLEG